jgi:hypothetical protein
MLTIGHEQHRQHDDGEDEIRDRAAGDDGGALTEPLAVKRHLPLGRGELAEPRDRQARAGIAVAEHLDVTAERDGAELPAGAGAVPPAEDFGAEADREYLDPHPVPPGDQVVAELVNEHEHRQHHQKNADVQEAAVDER